MIELSARKRKIIQTALALLIVLAAFPLALPDAVAADRITLAVSRNNANIWITPNDLSDNGISFEFDPEVSDSDRADIVEGTRLGRAVIGIFVGTAGFDDILVVASAHEAEGSPYTMAGTRGQHIEVFTGGRAWQSAPQLLRIETMAHELMHVYQNALEGNVFERVPLWFDEGTAEALGYLAITQLGIVDQNDIYALNLFMLTHTPVTGSLAGLTPYGSMTAASYPLAYIAVQYLLGRNGLSVSTLTQIYELLAQEMTFADAFATVFGQTLADYYVEFDQWRMNLLTVASPPLDFITPHRTSTPATVSWKSIQTQVERNQQLVLAVSTRPGAECTVLLLFANDPVERRTTANAAGEAFWLVTIPASIPAGNLSARASCGDNLVWQDILVA